MVLNYIILPVIALMFWQPQMGSDYRPPQQHTPTRKESFISRVTEAIRDERYRTAIRMLNGRGEYESSELPIDYWMMLVLVQEKVITSKAKKLEEIRDLERILRGS